jgi:hypothetical protein
MCVGIGLDLLQPPRAAYSLNRAMGDKKILRGIVFVAKLIKVRRDAIDLTTQRSAAKARDYSAILMGSECNARPSPMRSIRVPLVRSTPFVAMVDSVRAHVYVQSPRGIPAMQPDQHGHV